MSKRPSGAVDIIMCFRFCCCVCTFLLALSCICCCDCECCVISLDLEVCFLWYRPVLSLSSICSLSSSETEVPPVYQKELYLKNYEKHILSTLCRMTIVCMGLDLCRPTLSCLTILQGMILMCVHLQDFASDRLVVMDNVAYYRPLG